MGKLKQKDNAEGLKLREIRDKDGWTDEARELFNQKLMVSKQEVLDQIDLSRKEWESERISKDKHSEAFYEILLQLVDRFRNEVESRPLFKNLEPFWCYSIKVKSTGMSLILNYYSYIILDDDGEIRGTVLGAQYEFIKVSTRHLLVEEYASRYGVEPNTVRMWIRRGKIRTAIKSGREWQIPELTDMPERGYSMGQYEWREPIINPPEEFSYLSRHHFVTINQSQEDKSVFVVSFLDGEKKDCSIKLSVTERERLELYLISNPLVIYVNDGYADIYKKAVSSEKE